MVLVDANVLIDLFTNDPKWADWAEQALAEAAATGELHINPVIYAEVSIAFKEQAPLENALDALGIIRSNLPYPAGLLAGMAFMKYRQRGGLKRSPLPDFFIGAHALHIGGKLLTRDPRRYRTYFPELKLICPED
jgi:predicted nucleic acid-binding protein